MVDITAAIVTTITGLTGIAIGASISNYVSHKVARMEGKKDTLFKKRLEYFEKITETVIKNIQMYKHSIKQLEKSANKKEINSIIKSLKKDRKKFEVMSSPLYFDTRLLSSQIKHFVNIEKGIFFEFEKMVKNENPRTHLSVLKDYYQKLNWLGRNIIFNLRENILHG